MLWIKWKVPIKVKKVDNYDHEWKSFIIVMSNNSPESVTDQKSYREKKNKEKCLGKYRRYYEGSKVGMQKWLVLIDTRQKEQDKKKGYTSNWHQNMSE